MPIIWKQNGSKWDVKYVDEKKVDSFIHQGWSRSRAPGFIGSTIGNIGSTVATSLTSGLGRYLDIPKWYRGALRRMGYTDIHINYFGQEGVDDDGNPAYRIDWTATRPPVAGDGGPYNRLIDSKSLTVSPSFNSDGSIRGLSSVIKGNALTSLEDRGQTADPDGAYPPGYLAGLYDVNAFFKEVDSVGIEEYIRRRTEGEDDPNQFMLDFLSGLGGGGGGGGGARAVYQAPDRRSTEDTVKGLLTALVGRSDSERVQELANLLETDDQRRFNGEAVDPFQSILTRIRTFHDYSLLHENRPEFIDELAWVPLQQEAALRAGVPTGSATERALQLAQQGVNPADVADVVGPGQVQQRGRATPQLFSNIQAAAEKVARTVV